LSPAKKIYNQIAVAWIQRSVWIIITIHIRRN
jgi:hypothetical protein